MKSSGLLTGHIDIDRILNGFQKDTFIILAARPGMGKSMLENNWSSIIANNGYRVARFNLEMDIESLLQRSVSSISGIPLNKIRYGKLNELEQSLFAETIGKLSENKMWIDDSGHQTITRISAKCKRLQAEHGLDLVTVDYLGLVDVDKTYGNRVNDVGIISRGLKRLAKDLHVPVIALAQLSRACEARQDKRPMLSDLRDSGTIEQDADIVIFIYRDDYYNKDASERPNIAEANIAKHRQGETGKVDLYFNARLMRFSNLQREEINL